METDKIKGSWIKQIKKTSWHERDARSQCH